MSWFLISICCLFQLMNHDSFRVREKCQTQLTKIALKTDIRSFIITNMANRNAEIRSRSKWIWLAYCDVKPDGEDFFPCIDNCWTKRTELQKELFTQAYKMFIADESGIAQLVGEIQKEWRHKGCRARLATQFYIRLMMEHGTTRQEAIDILNAGASWEKRLGITPND